MTNNFAILAESHLRSAEQQLANKPASIPAQNNIAQAGVYAQLAQVQVLQSIAVSLAALVEMSGGRNMVDIVGDGDFTDGLDDEGELPF